LFNKTLGSEGYYQRRPPREKMKGKSQKKIPTSQNPRKLAFSLLRSPLDMKTSSRRVKQKKLSKTEGGQKVPGFLKKKTVFLRAGT